MTLGHRPGRATEALHYRPARDVDLLTCAQIWSDSIADYVGRLNQPWFGGDLEPLRRLLAHFLATDPDRFRVATAPATDGHDGPVVGFASATLRGEVWFLGMLFVMSSYQGAGVGRRLLEGVLPADARRAGNADAGTALTPRERLPVLATATDTLQPISNALYSQYAMVPRLPVFNFVGYPQRPDALGSLPGDVRLVESAPASRAADLADLAAIDRATLGHEHPTDHDFLFAEGRRLFVARTQRGEAVGYGVTAPSGRFGPVAALNGALLPPIVGGLFEHVRAPGARASWIPGAADQLFVALLRAGLRFESFPTLILWDRPFADFSRYVPINLALL